MNSFLSWWYRVSLPRKESPDTSPAAREKKRYARLTTVFTLLLLILTALLTPWSLIKYSNPAAPVIALLGLAAVVVAVVLNKMGLNIPAATMIVLSTVINVTGTMITNPLDPTFVPVFSALVIPVILAGALMPPVAALIAGIFNSALILAIALLQKHTAAYDQMMRLGMASVAVALPITLQIIVAVVTYVIMTNLISTIHRADRAEEIVALQAEISEFERKQALDQEQLEKGITMIAQVHTEIAAGNFTARVPLSSDHVLWQIAVPLNNLLNRVQQWKTRSDQMERTQAALHYAVQEMQQKRGTGQSVVFRQRTGTAVDPLLSEINALSESKSQGLSSSF
jgi:xanthosine utilization system XapX-like protein